MERGVWLSCRPVSVSAGNTGLETKPCGLSQQGEAWRDNDNRVDFVVILHEYSSMA